MEGLRWPFCEQNLTRPGAQLFKKETAYGHLQVVRSASVRYGRPQAYYVDQHKIFRFVEHQGILGPYHLGPGEADNQDKRVL